MSRSLITLAILFLCLSASAQTITDFDNIIKKLSNGQTYNDKPKILHDDVSLRGKYKDYKHDPCEANKCILQDYLELLAFNNNVTYAVKVASNKHKAVVKYEGHYNSGKIIFKKDAVTGTLHIPYGEYDIWVKEEDKFCYKITKHHVKVYSDISEPIALD